MKWIVYILECSDESLYTGITTDLTRRVLEHQAGTGAKYTRNRGPFTVRYTEVTNTKNTALQREAAIKTLNRSAKLALITPPGAQSRTARNGAPSGLPPSTAAARRLEPAASGRKGQESRRPQESPP
ncbi:MAG TPA: GIY-YIG nuclease family protein [Nitrospira sp.]|nr:GIY-YIG nuclease family protein [Nitrospira sp.]